MTGRDPAKHLADAESRRFQLHGASISTRLRKMADEVDAAMAAPTNFVGAPEHGWRAQQVIHHVLWGVANLNLDSLSVTAAEADRDAWIAYGGEKLP